jgi:F0F1-type ATP synthase epsilon subunit
LSTARLVAEGLLVLTDNALERLAEVAAERDDFEERSGARQARSHHGRSRYSNSSQQAPQTRQSLAS